MDGYAPEVNALLDFLWNEYGQMDGGDHTWVSHEDTAKLEQLLDAIPHPSNPDKPAPGPDDFSEYEAGEFCERQGPV